MKRIFGVLFALLLLMAIFMVGWTANGLWHEHPKPPARPSNVPERAKWAGGADGGMWVACEHRTGVIFKCEVFADVTGHLVESELFEFNFSSGIPSYYSAGTIVFDNVVFVKRMN